MKTRVSIINYSNTIPFSYGLLTSEKLRECVDFSYGYPAQVTEKLQNGDVDMSIISVGAIHSIPHAHIVTKYCVSATQRVDSVLLCSNKPLEKIETIMLDYQSRTTNILVQILVHDVWQITPQFVMGQVGYEQVHDDVAKVIIGDRALLYASQYKYVYDLAYEWNQAFHLPFVFAAWVANKPLSDEFVAIFEQACEFGVNHIDDAIAFTNKSFQFDIRNYLYHSVEYEFTDQKREAMQLYFEKGKRLNLL